MRRILMMAVAVGLSVQLADGQQRSSPRFMAKSIDVTGTVKTTPVPGTGLNRIDADRTVQLRGDVVLRTDTAVIHADEADYNPKTREAVLRGNVRIEFSETPILTRPSAGR
jgi:lipopolysaccharide assembly outer membrane protein LptD (OstA)